MERPNYELEQNPQYNEDIPQLRNDDPVLAESGAFHDLIVQSLNNTKASYQKAEKAQQTADRRASITLSHEGEMPAKGDNTYTFQVTELSDVTGELDGERLENARRIGELEESFSGWKVVGHTDLGLGSKTMETDLEKICKTMPDKTFLYYNMSSSAQAAGTYPVTSTSSTCTGTVYIKRYARARIQLEFWSGASEGIYSALKWFGTARIDNDIFTFSGWEQIASTSFVEGKLEEQLNRWRIYSSLEELGFTNGQEVLEEVCAAMPIGSILYCTKAEANITEEYPHRFGLLKIEKRTVNRCALEFCSYNGMQPVKWMAWYASNINEPRIRGWRYLGAESGTWTPNLTDESGNDDAVYSLRRGKWARVDNMVHLEILLTVTDPGALTGNLQIPLPTELLKDNSTVCYPQSPLRMSNIVLPQHAFATILDAPGQTHLRPVFYTTNTSTGSGISTLTGKQVAEGISAAGSVTFHGSIDYMAMK